MPKMRRPKNRMAINPRFECKSSGNNSVEMLLYGDIGSWYEVNAQNVARALAEHKGKDITVRINTMGGELWEATAIHNLLKAHDGTVNTVVDGLCASAGNHILLAGKNISMASNAMLMVHKPLTFAYGNADQMRETADMLDKATVTLVVTYKERTGLSDEDLSELLAKDTYLTAEEAKEKGFVDSIGDESKTAPAKEALPSAKDIENRYQRTLARRAMAEPILNHVPDVPANTTSLTTEDSAMDSKVKAALFARGMVDKIDVSDEVCQAALKGYFQGQVPETDAEILDTLNGKPVSASVESVDVQAQVAAALKAEREQNAAENNRQAEIRATCKRFGLEEMAEELITNKASIADVNAAILKRLEATNSAVPEDNSENTAGKPKGEDAKYDEAFKNYVSNGGTHAKEDFIDMMKDELGVFAVAE